MPVTRNRNIRLLEDSDHELALATGSVNPTCDARVPQQTALCNDRDFTIHLLAASEAMSLHRGKKTAERGGREVLEDVGGQKDFDIFSSNLGRILEAHRWWHQATSPTSPDPSSDIRLDARSQDQLSPKDKLILTLA